MFHVTVELLHLVMLNDGLGAYIENQILSYIFTCHRLYFECILTQDIIMFLKSQRRRIFLALRIYNSTECSIIIVIFFSIPQYVLTGI